MKGTRYERYLLTVLLVILTFNYLDRSVLALAAQDIKSDLALSDTQFGLLSGIAFAFFYSVMGIPIARWADRGDRVAIISVTTALWSCMAALCGAAGTFLQLLLVRIGVAVGESGCIPPALSLISDHFHRSERPRAVAIYMLGAPLSIVVGYFVAGWLIQLYGWRLAFVFMALPGLGLAALARLSLREPRVTGSTAPLPVIAGSQGGETAAHPGFRQVAAALWGSRTFRNLLFCTSILFFFNQGIWQWQPAFFIRSYDLEVGTLGTWLALTVGVTGVVGTFIGGEWAARAAASDESRQLKAMAIAFAGFGVVSACVYLVSSHYTAFALVALGNLGAATTNGPLFATIQTVVPERVRALSVAIVYLFANLIGTGLGPLAAGALSDAFRPWAGDESLRYALLALCPGYVWGAWHLWRAGSSVMAELSHNGTGTGRRIRAPGG